MKRSMRSIIDDDTELGRHRREAHEILARTKIAADEVEARMPDVREIADVKSVDLGVREVVKPHGDRRGVGTPFDRAAALRAANGQADLQQPDALQPQGGKNPIVEGRIVVSEADSISLIAAVLVGELGEGEG